MTLNLDKIDNIKDYDPSNILGAIATLADQCATARQLAAQWEVPAEFCQIQQIIVSGMGGSAIGGDLLRVYASTRARVPVMVVRDYRLPAFVGPETLLIATSFSGNTEETLSVFREAQEKGAKIVVITSGGELLNLTRHYGYPAVVIPGGISPRAATGYLLIPALMLLERLNLISGIEPELDELEGMLRHLADELGPNTFVADNLAKQIALRLVDKLPVIYGVVGTTETVATRWKGQINENAKAPAVWNQFPELNHNEIVGFEYPADLLKRMEIVILRDRDDHPRIQQRIDITKGVIAPQVAGIIEVESRGESALARTFSLTYIGDYVSYYLALLNGADPTPVKMIDHLKNELAKREF